jgi:hypothetical protein
VNATDLIIFRLRSKHELDALVEENSAVYGPDALVAMYDEATKEPYSFLYVKLTAKAAEDMFWVRFDRRLAVGYEQVDLKDSSATAPAPSSTQAASQASHSAASSSGKS